MFARKPKKELHEIADLHKPCDYPECKNYSQFWYFKESPAIVLREHSYLKLYEMIILICITCNRFKYRDNFIKGEKTI